MSNGVLRTNWAEPIEGDPSLRERVRQADQILAEVVGKSAAPATATWDIVSDGAGRRLLQLTLSDSVSNAQVGARFQPDELDLEPGLVARLRWLWGDLLQARSHRQLEELLKADTTPGK